MRKITFSEATREAMAEEMEKYPECFVMGEDIARQGGIFGQFKGLPDQFPGRVIDTPISETFIVGGGVGAALAGARPVVDMHFADFIGVAMDEVFNQMAICSAARRESPWSCALPTVWPAAVPLSTPRVWRAGSSTSPASRSWPPPILMTPRWS